MSFREDENELAGFIQQGCPTCKDTIAPRKVHGKKSLTTLKVSDPRIFQTERPHPKIRSGTNPSPEVIPLPISSERSRLRVVVNLRALNGTKVACGWH